MKVQKVFTPYEAPTVTYVDRSEFKLEKTLRDHYDTKNLIISVSGPSKSGKSVLIEKVIAPDYLIKIVGSVISDPDNLWQRVLNWMGAPSESTIQEGSTKGLTIGAEAGGKAGIPLVAEGATKVTGGGNFQAISTTSHKFVRDPLLQVQREISDSDFVVFIEDFHYIKEDIRSEIGRQIKAAAEAGVKIITASVPHRSDDVVRTNPELIGRVAAVDLKVWSENDLSLILERGFEELNLVPPGNLGRRLASEAFGSPQLMQSICLNLCYVLDIRDTSPEQKAFAVSEDQYRECLLRAASFTDSSKMLTVLQTGPRTRGVERKTYALVDGSQGDVYRAVLLALKQNPAKLNFSYDDVLARVKSVCSGDWPVGSSITSALEQMQNIGEEQSPGFAPFSWDSDALDVANPYFLFFLRSSNKLSELGRK